MLIYTKSKISVKGIQITKVICISFSTKSEIWEKLISRDNGIEVTLLPIPNRKVKVYSADGTAWETVWESRTLRGKMVH